MKTYFKTLKYDEKLIDNPDNININFEEFCSEEVKKDERDFQYYQRHIYEWVISSHYIMSKDIKAIERALVEDKYLFSGPYLSINNGNIRNCMYTGGFYWLYPKKIYNQYKEDLRDILKQLCSYKGVEILEGHLMPDHIHMLVSIPPKYSVSSFMGYLKGKSALMMFDRHANLKYKFGNRHFWSEGYYVSTVGLNEATIRKYIQDQEKYDIMVDKLSVKEYENPFKG